MAHHDVVENNPKKEIATALIGIVLLVAIIGGIALFGWLRPAGDHYPRTADAETVGAEAAPTAVNAQAAAADTAASQTVTESVTQKAEAAASSEQASQAGAANVQAAAADTVAAASTTPTNTASITADAKTEQPATDAKADGAADKSSQ